MRLYYEENVQDYYTIFNSQRSLITEMEEN